MKGERIYQISGGRVEEKQLERMRISEEDILLVAQQAGVSLEEARKALEEAEGDLAKAILMLKTG
jgi:nascent polypeptide-associated complex subunit alpha